MTMLFIYSFPQCSATYVMPVQVGLLRTRIKCCLLQKSIFEFVLQAMASNRSRMCDLAHQVRLKGKRHGVETSGISGSW